MPYYTDLFTPETYQAFANSERTISGFRSTQQAAANKIHVGDKFVCYMTKLSRWIGILEVESECFVDETPIFYPSDDPFVVRFRVRPTVWLPRDRCVPIHDQQVWDTLSFTRGTLQKDGGWTGMVRRSLNRLPDEDGEFLEKLRASQDFRGETYPVNDDKFRKLVSARIRRADKTVSVTVPEKRGR